MGNAETGGRDKEPEGLPWDPDYAALTPEQQELWSRYQRKPSPCKSILSLKSVPSWHDCCLYKSKLSSFADPLQQDPPLFPPTAELNKKIALYLGNICSLEIDAIINAANRGLLGGGGVDGAIHAAAGPELSEECHLLKRPGDTGKTKITLGYNLPARYVLHTIGPIGENPSLLLSCYQSCLKVAQIHNIRSIGFCGISTGIYGYPPRAAALLVLQFIRRWLEVAENAASVDRIIFIQYTARENEIYESLLPRFFPPDLPTTARPEDELADSMPSDA